MSRDPWFFFFLSSFSSCAHNFACAASPLAQLGESALGRQRSVASHTHDRAKKNQKKTRGKKEKGETRQARKGGPQSRPFRHITKQQTTRRMEREWRCFHGDSSFFLSFSLSVCVCFRENWEARSRGNKREAEKRVEWLMGSIMSMSVRSGNQWER